jgi:hypothetical protein
MPTASQIGLIQNQEGDVASHYFHLDEDLAAVHITEEENSSMNEEENSIDAITNENLQRYIMTGKYVDPRSAHERGEEVEEQIAGASSKASPASSMQSMQSSIFGTAKVPSTATSSIEGSSPNNSFQVMCEASAQTRYSNPKTIVAAGLPKAVVQSNPESISLDITPIDTDALGNAISYLEALRSNPGYGILTRLGVQSDGKGGFTR